ncbi:helix-turn-helix domain-containing protein [Phragmitibacter flavus]|uniref:Helix-turn-helix domain-containing protein n=1 Tax=Phragmitibacter flavus TaxID=2576071 RepID=A0A5R8KC55_9BACT|nr:AraC family transcriptional regulator [Phragmitibacter flavus]TLD69894.1 helix-turn-helix domain-containing protein [Phragmitibacter flavus]
MELTLVQRGSGTRFVGDHIAPFESLDVVLIGANVPHYWRGLHHSTGYALQWRFEANHPFWQFPESQSLKPLWPQTAHGIRFTGKTATTIVTLIENIAHSSSLERLSHFIQLLHHLAKSPKRDQQRLSTRPFDLASVQIHQPAIERVIRHVLKNFRDPIPLKQVLKLANMSRATFARQFPKHAGKTFSAFVNQVRLESVCRDLTTTTETITNIAFSNGFNNLSSFNRMFRKVLKCSPKDYRLNIAAKD